MLKVTAPWAIKITAIKLLIPAVFTIGLHSMELVILFFTNLILVLLLAMIILTVWRAANEKNVGRYRLISGLLIRKAAFFDEEILPGTLIPVKKSVTKLLNNKFFRKTFTEELLSAKKNLSGVAGENLKYLYYQLGLEKYALQNLRRSHWHLKSKAIQELTLMDMHDLKQDLFVFTNNKNELVRMEAQVAVVQFSGFDGLAFLDEITYSISEWQQMKLLQKLANFPPMLVKIDGWLRSSNDSVVLFALKLARNFHTFDSHDIIISCLQHDNPRIRLEAIHCLAEIYTPETSVHLISRYWRESLVNQLAIIKVLQNIASEDDMTFLVTLMYNVNYDMQLAAARALAHSGERGLSLLMKFGANDDIPNHIILQVTAELAA